MIHVRAHDVGSRSIASKPPVQARDHWIVGECESDTGAKGGAPSRLEFADGRLASVCGYGSATANWLDSLLPQNLHPENLGGRHVSTCFLLMPDCKSPKCKLKIISHSAGEIQLQQVGETHKIRGLPLTSGKMCGNTRKCCAEEDEMRETAVSCSG